MAENRLKKVSVVVAVYQNEGSLTKTHQEIAELFANSMPEIALEWVFVNDGSTDGSLDELRQIRANDDRVRVITFTRNFGQMAAMLAGFKAATGEAVINISADLQDPVELMEEMIESWLRGSEIVVCYRTSRNDPPTARLFSSVAYRLMRMAVPQIPKGGFDYVLMDRVVMDEFNTMDVRHRFFQGDLLWSGRRTSFIPYERRKRVVGRSQYNLAKKLKNFIDAMLDASFLPIRFISLCGVATFLVGALYSISIVVAWSIGDAPFDGWAPLMIAVLMIGGAIMLMLGIIGEYVWRINEEVRKRPNYVIRDEL
ncbi:glycosyltransferase family 2 protein [Rhizobium sp. R86522]|uniref:glycosyltransferase family 2 protein n=1 Tax=Rhizobium sp. R86522 TaxID=3093861 RepID=UPI003670217E